MNERQRYTFITGIFVILFTLVSKIDFFLKCILIIGVLSMLAWERIKLHKSKSDEQYSEENQIKRKIETCFDDSGLRRYTFGNPSRLLSQDQLGDLDINNLDEWIQAIGLSADLAKRMDITNLETMNTFDRSFKEEDIFKFTQLIFTKMLDMLNRYDDNENLEFLIHKDILQSLKSKHDTYRSKKLEYTYRDLSFPFFEFERIYRENQQDIIYIYFRAEYDIQLLDNNYKVHTQKHIDKNYRFVFTRYFNEITTPKTYELNRSSLALNQWLLERYGSW